MALMDQGNRSADIRAEEDIICYALSMERLNEMSVQFPNIRLQLLRNIAQELAGRLRRANDEIAALFA
jgi:CRP-like cAMP-binding protein